MRVLHFWFHFPIFFRLKTLQKTEVVYKKVFSWSLSGACVFNKNGNQRGKRGNRECVWWGGAGLKAKRNCGHEAHSLSRQFLAGTQEWPGLLRGANEVIELFSGAGWACFSGDLETVAPFSHLAKEWCWCESFSPSRRVGVISRAWGGRWGGYIWVPGHSALLLQPVWLPVQVPPSY